MLINNLLKRIQHLKCVHKMKHFLKFKGKNANDSLQWCFGVLHKPCFIALNNTNIFKNMDRTVTNDEILSCFITSKVKTNREDVELEHTMFTQAITRRLHFISHIHLINTYFYCER